MLSDLKSKIPFDFEKMPRVKWILCILLNDT